MKRLVVLALLAAMSAPLPAQEVPAAEWRRRIHSWIQALGDLDPAVRDRAMASLRTYASEIETALRRNLDHSDGEIAGRCRDLVAELEENREAEQRVMIGRVIHVDGKYGFILLDAGKERGFGPDEPLQVVRPFPTGRGTRSRLLRIVSCTFEKYIGQEQSTSKLLIKEGQAADVRVDDLVVRAAGRPAPAPGKPAAPPKKGAALSGKVAMIHEAGGKFAIDLREKDGVEKGDRLDVLRDGKKIGILVVTDVQLWGSWAVPDGKTNLEAIRKGDVVERPELK